MKPCFQLLATFGFLIRHISRIVSFQIEIEKIYSLARIFNNLKRCLLLNNLHK
jgi:hypothetical protein